MNELPLVTVIIPCYNQAHFLGEAIESVLAQTYRDIEIIVVDDGSRDNTSEVADRYPSVRYIRQKNGGLSDARNRGVRESRGKFLIFLDSDDRLCPNGVEAGVACMAERPSSGLVYGRHRCMHEDGTPYPSPSQHKFHDDLYRGLLHYNFIGMVAAVMFRREVFDVVGGFNTDISPTADYDLYLRIASRYPSNYHHEIVAEYRIYGTSMSSDLAVMMRGVLISLQSQQRNIRGRKEYEEAYQEGMKFWRTYYGEPLYLEIARHYGDIRRWRRTLRGLGYLLRYYPQCIGFHAKSKADKMIARLRNKIAPGRDQGVGP